MYETNGGGVGTHAGTMVVGAAPAKGHYFSNLMTLPTTAVQARAMSGELQAPSIPCCDDVRYLQSIGPLTLAPGRTTVVWIAVVMGDDIAQMKANAIAAAADIASRNTKPASVAGASVATYGRMQSQSRVAAPVKVKVRIE